MTISPNARTVFRNYVMDGVPSSGIHKINKADIRQWGTAVETVMNAFTTNGGLIFATKTLMDAQAATYTEPRSAWVYADSTASNNGVYVLNPTTDTWTKVGRLPYDFVIGTDTGAGTANAIQITTDIPVADGMIVAFSLFEATTASPVTVSINGGAALTLKTNRGADASALTANMEIWGRVRSSDNTLRLLNDQDVSALVAQAEAARDEAVAARDEAIAGVYVPIFDTVDGMASKTIVANLNTIQIRGRSVVGDSETTVWVRVDSEPNVPPAEKFRTVDRFLTSGVTDATNGGWWQIKTTLPRVDLFTGVWTPQTALGVLQARMAAGEVIKLACYGDSTTDGNETTGWTPNPVDENNRPIGEIDHEATAPNAWPAKLKPLLTAMYGNSNIAVWNAGYSGKAIQNGWAYENYERAIISNPAYGLPDICLVAFGINDSAPVGSQIDAHILETRKLCLKIMAYGAIPVLLTCDPIGLTPLRDNREVARQIDAAKKAVAAELSIPLIDIGAATKRWLSRNADGYRWRVEQVDLTHFQNNGHAFKATFVAKELFPDLVRVEEGRPTRIASFDSAAGGSYGSLADGTNVLQGSTPTWGAVDPPINQTMMDAWVWNEEPDAELIYRGVGNENWRVAGTADAPKISLFVAITGVETIKTPAGIGFSLGSSPYQRSDLPYRFGRIPYGLSRVRHKTGPTLADGLYLGNFEIWKTVRGVLVSPPVRNFVKEFSAAPPTQVAFLPEYQDGSNVYGLFDGDSVDILADLRLPVGSGFVLAHSSAWGNGYGSRTFSYLYRASSTLQCSIGGITSAGVVTLATPLGSAAFTPGSDEFRLKTTIRREGDTQRVIVANAFAGGSTILDLSLVAPSSAGVHAAGAVGGLFWNSTSTGGFAEIKDLTLVRR